MNGVSVGNSLATPLDQFSTGKFFLQQSPMNGVNIGYDLAKGPTSFGIRCLQQRNVFCVEDLAKCVLLIQYQKIHSPDRPLSTVNVGNTFSQNA